MTWIENVLLLSKFCAPEELVLTENLRKFGLSLLQHKKLLLTSGGHLFMRTATYITSFQETETGFSYWEFFACYDHPTWCQHETLRSGAWHVLLAVWKIQISKARTSYLVNGAWQPETSNWISNSLNFKKIIFWEVQTCLWCILIIHTSIFLLLSPPRSTTTPSQLHFLYFFIRYSPKLRCPVTSECGANHHSVVGLPEPLSLNKTDFASSRSQPGVGLTPAFHTRIFPGWISCRQPQLLWVHNARILFSSADSFASILHVSGSHSLLMPCSETVSEP